MFNVNALARPSLHCPVTKAFGVYNKDLTRRHEKASEPTLFIYQEWFTGYPIIFEKTILFDLFC
ncbi:hypothetical protein [Prevotella sp. oral taxon 299]|uniref:hypothetical protein n=1 Tax=Prevotella sp. oral taxon 299 TaxID=652716 RepID=UPI0018DB266F|nr:hypothetical protein [Prevotella sp. oral taxon 299]